MKISALVTFLLATLFIVSCNNTNSNETIAPAIEQGRYLAHLQLNDTTQLPFELEWYIQDNLQKLRILNSFDTIEMIDVVQNGDSIYAEIPVFNAGLSFLIINKHNLSGAWHYYDKDPDFFVPFTAEKSSVARFSGTENACCPIEKPWAITIGEDKTEPHAIGDFKQNGNTITGSIITQSGDYRFLEGLISGHQVELATFDGTFAYVIKAIFSDENTLVGTFYSSSTTAKSFTARVDSSFSLADAASRTFLKNAAVPFTFTFPNLNGESTSFESLHNGNKVVIVQILGTWCPNCIDETRLLNEFYDTYKEQGLEIIGLGFERKADFESGARALKKMKRDLNMQYPVLFAGKAGAKEAAEALPMLNAVLAYPTTIFVDKKGNVRHIHTGFNGPGTSLYAPFVKETTALIERLLNE
ncbi:MAG: TlpA family protein disulfide reductase [Schleiferiaceae bacterium]|nr:TlpA family protein disulfide reductase [Schleiferiaceae bacterium]